MADAAFRVSAARLPPEITSAFDTRNSRNPEKGTIASLAPDQAGLNKTMAFIDPPDLTWELDIRGKNRSLLDAAIGEAQAQAGELEQALGGGYAGGPSPGDPKPAPEAAPITPTVETI
ncbi:MAG: hypothetical protein N2444_06405 [Methylocystis sp.]|nr:hypothetical protein [Methylocystis sp.]